MPKCVDPIEAASRITNRGNARSHARRIARERARLSHEERALSALEAKVWQPVFKKIRKVFRNEFRHPIWNEVWIDFDGRGYTRSGTTWEIHTWIEYSLYWKGFTIRGKFSPRCMDDVIAETWKLGGLLADFDAATYMRAGAATNTSGAQGSVE